MTSTIHPADVLAIENSDLRNRNAGLTLENALASARIEERDETIAAAKETITALTDRIATLSTSLGAGGAVPAAATVGVTAGALSPDAPAVTLSPEPLRVAAAIALVVLDGVHTLDAYHAAKGLRDAMGGT